MKAIEIKITTKENTSKIEVFGPKKMVKLFNKTISKKKQKSNLFCSEASLVLSDFCADGETESFYYSICSDKVVLDASFDCNHSFMRLMERF